MNAIELMSNIVSKAQQLGIILTAEVNLKMISIPMSLYEYEILEVWIEQFVRDTNIEFFYNSVNGSGVLFIVRGD